MVSQIDPLEASGIVKNIIHVSYHHNFFENKSKSCFPYLAGLVMAE